MEIKIYGLVDPRNNEIRYVGKTKNTLNVRLSRHINDKPKHNTYKHNWICSLKKENIKPIIIELETCNESNWIERERYWIKQYSNLTNLTAGGEGCDYYPQEVLDKMSKGNKKAWENPEYRKNISIKRKEFWSNPENRKNQANKITGKIKSKEECAEITKRNIEMWKNDEYREKMNKGASDRWKNDVYREKMLSYLNSEEHKNKISKLFKGKKRTNEEKEKISKNHGSNQPVSVDGIIYSSITVASVLIPMNRDKLKNRLNSKHFPQYYKIKKEV